MGFPATSRADLLQASRRNDLIVETGRQIQKDFGEFGLEVHFSGTAELFYEELFGQMKVHVAYLLSDNMDRFMHFLYRIDINEKDINMYKNQMLNEDYDHVLTELIIHRELKKVITRDYFRQQAKGTSDQGELED